MTLAIPISEDALKEILHAWGNVSTMEARQIGARYGLTGDKVKRLAIRNKVKAKRKMNRLPGCPNDPRWAWAKERGAVVA
jgi:hypothetical protein